MTIYNCPVFGNTTNYGNCQLLHITGEHLTLLVCLGFGLVVIAWRLWSLERKIAKLETRA